jgi:hypothetical protein
VRWPDDGIGCAAGIIQVDGCVCQISRANALTYRIVKMVQPITLSACKQKMSENFYKVMIRL